MGGAYRLYEQRFASNPSVNGRIFELLICETLARERVQPFYYQARFERVANADFDIALYHRTRPVVISCKTSLRERYKQADLEGAALKQVYRQAQCFLVTLSTEATNVARKIETGDVGGLDGCVQANTRAFSNLITTLRNMEFTEGLAVQPITGTFVPESNI